MSDRAAEPNVPFTPEELIDIRREMTAFAESDLDLDTSPIFIRQARLMATIDRLTAENEAYKMKFWRHGDECSSSCTPACSEMHTYKAGCWFHA